MTRLAPPATLVAAAFLMLARLAPLAAQQPAVADSAHQHGDTLRRVPVMLREVTVTAAPAAREAPAGATTVSRDELLRAPAINPYELLRQTAGLEVHDQGQGPGFASDASLRGFSSDHSTDIALWIDGVPNNEPVNGHAEGYNDWNVLMPQAVRELDVLKGPTSPLYGNFALAGTVNVRTLERMKGSQLWLSGGSYGRVDGALLTGVDREHTGLVLGVRGVREDGWRPNSGYWLGQLHGRAVRDVSSSLRLDGGIELYGSDWDSPGFITDSGFAAGEFDVAANPTDGGFKRRAQERLSLRYVSSGPPLIWRTTAYATQGRWQLFLTIPPEGGAGEGSGSQTEEEDHRYGFGLTSAVTYTPGRLDLTAGIESRWDHSHYENYFTTDRLRDSAQTLVVARQLSGAAFLQSTGDLGHHVRVSAGLRYERLRTRSQPEGDASTSDSKGIVAPKVGLLYHVPAIGEVYANVSRGYRQTDGVIEDPTLPFITAWAYETGVRFDRRQVRASAAVFRMDVSDEQTFDPITLTSTSGGASRRQGVELSLAVQPVAAVELRGEWTFNDAKYRRLVTPDGDTLSGIRVFNTAKYVGSATVAVRPPVARWDVQLSANVVGPYSPFDEPVELGAQQDAKLAAAGAVLVGEGDELHPPKLGGGGPPGRAPGPPPPPPGRGGRGTTRAPLAGGGGGVGGRGRGGATAELWRVQLITLSREYGAGGSELGVLLGAELDWPVLDRDLARRVAERLQCRHAEAAALTGASPAAAAADVRHRDADRRHYLERYCKCDANDPNRYDVQINTATIPLEVACHLIVELVAEPSLGP